jgi:hypothetical protein
MARSSRGDDRTAFWTTLPGILTGVAAVVTALGGLLAIFANRPSGGNSAAPESTVTSSALTAGGAGQPTTPAASPGAVDLSSASASTDACLASAFPDIPAARVKRVHDGVTAYTLLGPSDPKSGDIGILLLSDGNTVGALGLRFIQEGEFFTIRQVFDAGCAPVTDFANASRGGDPRVLQNWDEASLRLGGQSYLLRLGYSGGEVSVGHFRRVVE